jgi:hypothetical protein
MTTYTPILNAEVDAESPITDLLLTRLRDNPLAIGEAAAGVPLNALPTVLLGTLITTSGSTQTLSGLVLTPYKSIRAVWNGVSHSAGVSRNFVFAGLELFTGNGVIDIRGIVDIDLLNGVGYSIINAVNTNQAQDVVPKVIETAIVNATTSISVSLTGGVGSFNGGSIAIYGVK